MRRSVLLFPLLFIITILTANARSFERRWTFTAHGPFIGSAVVADGVIYAGSLDSTLYALDERNGRVVWSVRFPAPIRSTPSVHNGLLYINAAGTLTALDASSGVRRWSFATGGEKIHEPYGYADYYQSSPAVRNGTVYFGSGDGNVYAVNAKNGSLQWKFSTNGVVHASPAFDSTRLFIGSFDGTMHALDQRTGKELWSFHSVGHRFFPQGEMQGTPVAVNGLVCVGARDYNVYAIDAEKGYCHWNTVFPRGWALSLTPADSLLYIGTSDDDVIIAADAHTGTERWRTNVRFNTFGRTMLTDSLLIVGTLAGRVHALHRATGAIIATFETDGFRKNASRFFTTPNDISKERFYSFIRTPDDYIAGLYALGAIFSDAVPANRSVIITSTDGTVYSLSIP